MQRNVSLEEISDGKIYGVNDLVKADCHDCHGCSACCQGMGESIILDPYDIYRICCGLHKTFEQLMADAVALRVVDSIILPHLAMQGEEEACIFLNKESRCSIHAFRPGMCRLFPLGRYYENGSFRYFLQTKECKNNNRTKIKVRKWLDTPDMQTYEKFVADWHYFLKDIGEGLAEAADDALTKQVNMYLLQLFYMLPYEAGEECELHTGTDFYAQFYTRLAEAEKLLAQML